jgi:Glycosyl transferase family 90
MLMTLLLLVSLDLSNAMNENPIPVHLPKNPHLDQSRAERFPSREARVKLYMSNWYVPPCRSDSNMGMAQYEYTMLHHNAHHLDQPHNPSGMHENDEAMRKRTTVTVTEAANVVPASSSINGTNNNTVSPPRTFTIESLVTPDKTFVLDRSVILECANAPEVKHVDDKDLEGLDEKQRKKYLDRIRIQNNMRMYCQDVAQSLLPAMNHVEWEQRRRPTQSTAISSGANNKQRAQQALALQPPPPPILVQFGDLAHSHIYRFIRLPHFKKFRLAANRTQLERVTQADCQNDEPRWPLIENAVLQPIVWKLATHRHYGLLDQVTQDDIPWHDKKNMAVFRGQLTGSLGGGYNKHLTPEQNCENLMRCRLVYNHANSTLIDARLTSTRKRLPNILNGVELTTPSEPVTALLQYKGIVMLEGNDVASGLKWALLSQSVVLMPVPRHTSWAMEEWLEPWIHYIPLQEDAADVEEKMAWVLEHEHDAQAIAYASTLWMQDLIYHPDAAEDDIWIREEMVRRYQLHFAPVR